MSDFAKNIKRRRLELGLSQEQLAEKLAVTRQTVSNWERSVSFPDLPALERIAEALGTDPAELIYPGRKSARETGDRILYALSVVFLYIVLLFLGGLIVTAAMNAMGLSDNNTSLADCFILAGLILLAGFMAAMTRRE